MSIPVGSINETGLFPFPLDSGKEQPAVSGSFQATLNEMLSPDSHEQVNEEQLFAALINERLTSMKGAEAAEEFEERYQLQQKEFERADGYIFLENAAREALKETKPLEENGYKKELAETVLCRAVLSLI